jgi:hypothetical protein
MVKRVALGVCLVLAAGSMLAGGQTRDSFVQKTGADVIPIYEGWYKNPDGTLSLSFGYLNRNYEEEVDIPVGAANRIEPGPEDQGQPTHFYPRRQRGVFVARLPKDAGNRKVTWTLSVRGQTASVPANLGELYNIDALKSEGLNRIPPGLKLEAAGPTGIGPGGPRTTLKTVFPNAVTLDSWVVNTETASIGQSGQSDFRPRRQVMLTWSKFRGPGTVTFSSPTLSVNPSDKATTSATFSAPGQYVLRVLVIGDEMNNPTAQTYQCCWTNGYVQVSVEPAR